MKPAIIIGSGPAGLSMAYHLHRHGIPCTVISADSGPGGLARPVLFNNKLQDPGPHSFYSSYAPEAFALLHTFFRQDELQELRPGKMITTDRYTLHVPPRIGDLLRPRFLADGLRMVLHCRTHKARSPHTFEHAGARILAERSRTFHEVLFDPWCRKQFGLGSDRLDPHLVDLLAASRGRRQREHLVHPRSGAIGELWTRMAHALEREGVNFRYDETVTGMTVEQDVVVGIRTANSRIPVVGTVYSSSPLPLLASWVGARAVDPGAPVRSTILIYLAMTRIRTDRLYITDHRADEPVGRVTFCDNWRPVSARTGQATVCVEFWCSSGDGIHEATPERLVAHALRYLAQHRLADGEASPSHVVIGPKRTTPVPVIGYRQRQEALRASLAHVTNLHPIGRHAAHRWDGVDDAILETSRLANAHVRS